MKRPTKKQWHEYLWIASSLYLVLGLFNILFAWLGLICFLVPLAVALVRGNKAYCNRYCGRGQLFELLGSRLQLSRNRRPPAFLRSAWFRYGFLTFFMAMFGLMLHATYRVFAGATLQQALTLLWVFKLPWNWLSLDYVSPWIAQFAFGFYSVMLTSTILGLATMVLYRPRTWCVYCPMGTMTQGICKLILMESMNASKAARDFFVPLGAGAKRSSATLSGERQRGAEKDPSRRRIND